MDAILGFLTPEQVDAILGAFDSLEAWYNQAVFTITETINGIVIEDVML